MIFSFLGIKFIVLVVFIGATSAQVFSFGGCPSVTVVSNFNVSQYTGVWYENRKYFAIFELGQKCVTATYGDNGDSTVSVLNEAKRSLTGKSVSVKGTARLLASPSGKLGVTFANIPFSPTDAPYWVLGTDYTSYAVVWSCSSFGIFNSQIAWILTRNRSPDSSTISTALGVLSTNGISQTPLRLTNQSNC